MSKRRWFLETKLLRENLHCHDIEKATLDFKSGKQTCHVIRDVQLGACQLSICLAISRPAASIACGLCLLLLFSIVSFFGFALEFFAV